MSDLTPKPRRGDRLVVRVDRLSMGGRGVARHEGLVIFVPDTAPLEDVEIELTHVKKNFAEGRILRLIAPSPSRIAPPCPVAGVCGGCSWQHVAYDEQLRQKRNIVTESLKKFAGLETLVAPVVPSPNEFRYRNRVQLHHAPAPSGASLGFFRRGSHQIIAIDDCPITESVLCAEFPRLKSELRSKPAGRIEIYTDQQGRARLTDEVGAPDEDENGGVGTAFSQVNTKQNENLVRFVIELLQQNLASPETSIAVELYAGAGNFTFPLLRALRPATVRAVELNALSVKRAQDALATEFSERDLRFECSDVESWLARNTTAAPTFILLDPPRVGCGPIVMEQILKQRAQWIVYVSCHPVTLARDLQSLVREAYEVISVNPFDMFPQTDHVETVVLLKSRSTSPLQN